MGIFDFTLANLKTAKSIKIKEFKTQTKITMVTPEGYTIDFKLAKNWTEKPEFQEIKDFIQQKNEVIKHDSKNQIKKNLQLIWSKKHNEF